MAVNLKKKTPPSPRKFSFSMGVSPLSLYIYLMGCRFAGAYPLDGPGFSNLAWAISEAVDDWILLPTNLALAGVATGTVGVGYIPASTTKFIVPPTIPLMTGALAGAGITGPIQSSIATVVTLAVSSVFTIHGGYQGISPTVAVGADVSKVVISNPATLTALLLAKMAENQISGPAAPMLAKGLGDGISLLLLQGFGWGKVVGTPGPSPSTGASFSRVQ